MGSIAERIALPKRGQRPPESTRASRRARARLWDRVMTGVIWGVVIFLAALLLAFILYALIQGVSMLSLKFVFGADTSGTLVGPFLFNTFYILIASLLICVPIAVFGAVYLVEYARQGILTTVLRFATETLAGVPSIVLALFGFLVFVTNFGSGTRFGFTRIAGILTLVILNLPLMLRVCEDALRSVPRELREASAALGATKYQTIWRVMMPVALPALTTGVILTAGKMIGETAALIYTAGGSAAVNNWYSLDPRLPGATLTIYLYELHAEGVVANAAQIQNGIVALLVIILLVFNLGLRWLAGRVNRRLAGSVK